MLLSLKHTFFFKYCILCLLLLLSYSALPAKEQECEDVLCIGNELNNACTDSSIQSGVFAEKLQLENQMESETINNANDIREPESVYISASEFTYAGKPRTTLMGTPAFKETSIKTLPFTLLTGTYVGALTALHIYQMNTIWDSSSTFKIIEDGDYGLYVDKLGHFWGGYLNAYLMSEFLMGSGLSHKAATHWGAAMSLAYQSYVEILDGFGKGWGFSPSDMASNMIGIGFFLGQHYVPFLQNFTPKANYFPPQWFGMKKRDGATSFIDDYSAYTFMMSCDIHNMLPTSYKEYWPTWLHLGIGYTARNLVYRNGDRKYLIGLDVMPSEVLPDGGAFWNWFKQSLNYIRLPLPTLELSPDGPPKFHLFYPFSINIGTINF